MRHHVLQFLLYYNLRIGIAFQVNSQDYCKDIFSKAGLQDYQVNITLLEQHLPLGFTDDLACVSNESDDFDEVKYHSYLCLCTTIFPNYNFTFNTMSVL